MYTRYLWTVSLLSASKNAVADQVAQICPRLDVPSASTIYTKMVLAMNRESAPSAIAYEERFIPHGLVLSIKADRKSTARPELVFASDLNPVVLKVSQDNQSGNSTVLDQTTGQSFSGVSMFWSPTWSAVRSFVGAVPTTTLAPSPLPTMDTDEHNVSDQAPEKVIGTVLAVSDELYETVYVGEQQINGRASYHLHLTPRRNVSDRPLTDIFISRATYLVTAVVEKFKNDATISGYSGTMTLKFGRVGQYWIVTEGSILASAHFLLTHSSGSIDFAVSDVKFGAL